MGDNFSVQYPAGWTVTKEPHPFDPGAYIYRMSGDQYQSGTVNFFTAQAPIEELGLAQNSTQETIESSLEQLFPKFIKDIQSGFEKGEIANTEQPIYTKYIIDGHKAGSVKFSANYGTLKVDFLNIGTLIGNNIVMLSYSAPVEIFDQNLPIAEKILESVKFKTDIPDAPIPVLNENISSFASPTNSTGEKVPVSSSLLIEQSANPPTIQNIINENACSAPRTPVDVVFSIDSSASMDDNDPMNLRLNASKQFIDQLNSTTDHAAIVTWGGSLVHKSNLTSNFDGLQQEIENANETVSDTNYNVGIKEAVDILDAESRNASKILIFLSDGEHNGFEPPPIPFVPASLIDYATEKKYKIYTIGLNISSDSDGEKLLRAMSEPTGGKYFSSPSPENLKEIFNSIFVQEVQHFEFQPTNTNVAVKGFGGTSERTSPVNVVFSIDGSGSMDENDPNDLRLDAAKIFMDKLDPQKDAAGIVSWSSKVDLAEGLTSEFNSLKEKADTIERREGTNLNIGILSAMQMLNVGFPNENLNPSKSIVFLTDGKGEYTKSGLPASPADEARFQGYKIFPIGLNVEGTEAEKDLMDIASASGGQYFSAPTAENLQAVYEDIFERVVESTAPANLTLVEYFPDYVQIDPASFTVVPTNISKNEIGQTIVQWQNISRTVGDKENKLSIGEEFSVGFKVGFNDNIIKHLVSVENNASAMSGSNESRFSFKAPLIEGQQSVVRYLGPNGFDTEDPVPPTFINLQISTCENQEITGLAKDITESTIFKRYSGPNSSFSIDYPSGWEIEQTFDRVTFDSPQDHPYDEYSENVDVYVFETNWPTLRELVNAIIEDDKVDIAGYNLTEVKSGTLGGHPSRTLLYTYSDSSWGPTQTMETISLVGGKYYLVEYSATPLQFHLKLPIVDHMIESITINR